MQRYGVAICHYDRHNYLPGIVESVRDTTPPGTKIVIADDGSPERDHYRTISKIADEAGVILIQGPNKGVAANKNRALWALQDCANIVLLEDDLKPIEPQWLEMYEAAAAQSGIHHFCRVQDKVLMETVPAFTGWMEKQGLTPIYGPSPRGDLTYLTNVVVQTVGAFNPLFRGAGYAHGEWSKRVDKAGLIGHPLKWIDILQAQQKFVQVGDKEGGRWNNAKNVDKQIKRNKQVLLELNRRNYIYHDLVLE